MSDEKTFNLLSRSRRIKTAGEAHAPAMARGARCLECPLFGKKEGPVLGEVRPGSQAIAIGDAPGSNEVDLGAVFVGASGEFFNRALFDGGLHRHEISVVNVLGCRNPPPDDLATYLEKLNKAHKRAVTRAAAAGEAPPAPPLSPIEACWPRLVRDIEESGAKHFLPIGGRALQATARYLGLPYGAGPDTLGKTAIATIKQQHGSPIEVDGRFVCSSLHPAFAMRERAYTYVVHDNIKRAAQIIYRGYVDWKVPEFVFGPSIERIEETCRKFVESGVPITFDIETSSAEIMTCEVRCVGMGAKLPGDELETIIVIPLRWMDGRDYWASDSLRARAEAAIRLVLDSCPLIAHNGAFDTSVCQRVGLMSRDARLATGSMKRWDDTLLAHHDTDANDLPHDLGFVVRQYTEAPLWKKDVDHKAAAGVAQDYDLHAYNFRDVLGTSRIWPQLSNRMAFCGTLAQYETDKALAPITREMSKLGVPVDEVYRGLLSVEFNKIVAALRVEFAAAVGKDINPRSSQQIGTWLYEDQGLTPPMNPQGFEWEEGDDWSTSTPALLKLLDQGVDTQVSSAIDALLKFRAAETIRGRYVDKIKVAYHEDDAILASAGRAPAVYLPDGTCVLPERPAISVVHPSWKIHVVPTGRWSSEPNCQNWPSRAFVADNVDPEHRDPITGEMKINPKTGKAWPKRAPTNLRRLVVAPPGHVFVGGDFSQIELRLYAVMAQDRLLLKAFNEGLDPHTLNAATLFASKPNEIMPLYEALVKKKKGSEAEQAELKYLRTIAKRFAFLEVYGGEEGKLFSVMTAERDKATGERVFHGLSEKRVSEWHRRWHDSHPETKMWQAKKAYEVRDRGYTQAIGDNRRRYFPGGASKKNAPPNHEIQGSAAWIANDSVLKIVEEMPFRSWSPWTGLCLQVHDQLMALVPESRADEAIKIFEKCMYHEVGGLPIFAEVYATRDWAKQG